MDPLIRCPRCWKHVTEAARFCPRCGSGLQVSPPAFLPRQPVAAPQPQRGGGGVWAVLMFMVLSAIGLVGVFALGVNTHGPMVVPPPPTPPMTVQPDDPAWRSQAERDQDLPSPPIERADPRYPSTPRPMPPRAPIYPAHPWVVYPPPPPEPQRPRPEPSRERRDGWDR